MISRIFVRVTNFFYPLYNKVESYFMDILYPEDPSTHTLIDSKQITIFESHDENIMDLFLLEPDFLEKKPEKVLVLDLDNTLLHAAKSSLSELKEPELLFEEQFQKIFKLVKKMNALTLIGTARYLDAQDDCPPEWQVSEVIKKLEKSETKSISAVVYTNNIAKYFLLLSLKDHFKLSEKDMCLVDDNKTQLDGVKQKKMNAVDILGEKPFEKISNFLNPTTPSEIEEPTTPVIQEYSFLKPKRLGFKRNHEDDEKPSVTQASHTPPLLP